MKKITNFLFYTILGVISSNLIIISYIEYLKGNKLPATAIFILTLLSLLLTLVSYEKYWKRGAK